MLDVDLLFASLSFLLRKSCFPGIDIVFFSTLNFNKSFRLELKYFMILIARPPFFFVDSYQFPCGLLDLVEI